MNPESLALLILAARGVKPNGVTIMSKQTERENQLQTYSYRFVLVLCCMTFVGVAVVTHSFVLIGITFLASLFVGRLAWVGFRG